jgi:DNA-binding transcriptional regulator PaaX
MRELGTSQKTFERDVSRLRSIGLLHGKHTGNEYRYYVSYEGFSIWLKTLRDLIYSLTKREGEA